MIQIENEFLAPSDFYSKLYLIVKERIIELQDEIKTFENIEVARGMFGYEKSKRVRAGVALSCNEEFMLKFDKNYLKMQ
jgi:hypothetical protein